MSAIRDISDTIKGQWCCYCEDEPACETCPYFDDIDPMNCSYRLNCDIQYYLNKEKNHEVFAKEEQPYLPGIEKEFDLSKVKFLPGDYIMLNGVKYTYGIDLEEGINNGQIN